MVCRACGSDQFRSSALRLVDLFWLLSLRRPVRCRKCNLRTPVNLVTALLVRKADKLRHHERRHTSASRRRMQPAN